MCTNTPKENPKAVKTPIFLEFSSVFLIQITKSGPGAITAIKWTKARVKIKVSIISNVNFNII